MTPAGVAPTCAGRAQVELARVQWMQAVDVLHRVDRPDHSGLVDVLGQRQLHEEAVDSLVGVQLLDLLEQLLLGGLATPAGRPVPGSRPRRRPCA